MTQRDRSIESTSDLGTPWTFAVPSFQLAETAYQSWLASTERIQSEALEFLSGRMEKVLETARELGSCTNPADYLVVQAKYAEGAMADWLAESQKLAELMTELAQESTNGTAKRKTHASRSTNGHRASH